MPRLNDNEIADRLAGLGGWERHGDAIEREYRTADFAGSVDFLNRVAPVAEEMNHHPDVSISWNRVTVSLSTHSQGGLTESDFGLAEWIDALA